MKKNNKRRLALILTVVLLFGTFATSAYAERRTLFSSGMGLNITRKADTTIIITYSATEGGSVKPANETVITSAKEIAVTGSVATAEEGYVFSGWTDAEGKLVSEEAAFVPAVTSASKDAVYTATFTAEAAEEAATSPATTEPETPAASETPAEAETPAEPEASTEPETPAESEPATEAEASTEPETPAADPNGLTDLTKNDVVFDAEQKEDSTSEAEQVTDAETTTDETPATEPEAPEEPETPAEAPAENNTPAESETSAEPETPAEPEPTTEPEAPAEAETPAESETPAEPEPTTEPETVEATEEEKAEDPENTDETKASENKEEVKTEDTDEANETAKTEEIKAEDTEKTEETTENKLQIVLYYADSIGEAPVRTDPDGLAPIALTLNDTEDENAQPAVVAVLGTEGDWIKILLDDNSIGYIYKDDVVLKKIDEPTTEETEAETPKKVTIFTSRRIVMELGEPVYLTSKLEGFENCQEIMYIWKVDKGNGFEEVPDSNSPTYEFTATAESLCWGWHLTVLYR